MTAVSTVIRSGAGLRHVQVLALNADSRPAATATTPAYEGVTVSGAVSLTVNDAEPQQIVHRGDDVVFALDTLPPSEPISAQLTVSKINDTLDAILGDVISVTVGEAKVFGFGTDVRGDENQVCLMAYQQTEDTDPSSASFGARRWHFQVFPRAYVIPLEGGQEQDTGTQKTYTIRPLFCTAYPWGLAFSSAVDGYSRSQGFRGISNYKPKIVAWEGDGAVVDFEFPSDTPAVTTDTIMVWIDGVETTPDTLATTQFQFTTGAEPTTGADIVVFYEHS